MRSIPVCALMGVVVSAGCARDRARVEPAASERVVLEGIAGLPAMDIAVPAFARPTQLDGVEPVVYMLTGGSLRVGLLVDIMVGANPHPGTGLDRLPRCDGRVTRSVVDGHAVETCDERRGRATTVHHADRDLICRATWRSDDPTSWREVIAGVDAACASLRVR